MSSPPQEPGPFCFVCGAAAAGPGKTLPGPGGDVSLRTCAECRARMRRARDARDLALTEEGRGYALWKAIDVAGASMVLAAGFFIALWAGWADARLAWGGWVALGAAVPLGGLVFVLMVRADRHRPGRWAASDEKKQHDALIAEVRGKLAAAGVGETGLGDTELIDPRTWEQSD